MMAESSRPLIVLLALNKQPFWDELYADLLRQLNAKATVQELTDVQETGKYLTTPKASAIIVTDEGIVKKPDVSKKLVEYVRNGGTVICATLFSSSVRPNDLGKWFRESWELPWESCDYHRSDTTPNASRMASRLTDERLPGPYSQKALGLKNVPAEAKVYEDPDNDRNSPVVFASYGKGWLGYMGDVNAEEESTKILLSMCDL